MTSAALRAKMDNAQPAIERIAEYVRSLLLGYCADHPASAFLERRKGTGSLEEKLESGRYLNWSSVDDLYAATLVVPTLPDEQEAHAFIRAKVFVVDAKLRGTLPKAPQQFLFESPRFKCHLRAPSGMEGEAFYSQLFEIQTRTAFEHAWSVTTHKLSYKAPVVDWRALRVAAQLKAAVEQLDNIILAYDHLVHEVVPSPDERIELQALIGATALRWRDQGLVPSSEMPSSTGRFSENVYALFQSGDLGGLRTRIRDALLAVQDWLSASGNAFPQSLSLFQLLQGVCAEKGLLAAIPDYTFFITEECASLFPAVMDLAPRFSYAE